MRLTGRCFGKAALLLAISLLAACSHAPPPPPEPVPETAPPTGLALSPTRIAGAYRLITDLSRRRPSGRRGQRPAETALVLSGEPSAVPVTGAPASTFGATIAVPGYTTAPRGRAGQMAAWWPIPGDSVVIQFESRQRGDLQLRGQLAGTVLRGEVWLVSAETGQSFQLGTFSATRQGR